MRANRVIIVGDPIQVPPVVLLPDRLTTAICHTFGVDAQRFSAPQASVQTLADDATAWFAEFPARLGSRTVTAQSLAGQRRTETSVMRGFEKDRPKMLGFLFSCVSAAIANRNTVEDAVERGDLHLPRMADFAEFVEGAATRLGLPLGGFSKLLSDGQAAMQTEAVLGTPVGAALVSYFSDATAKPLNASAKDILQLLRG